MATLTDYQLSILGKMSFDRYYKTNELRHKLGVDREFMLNLEKAGLVHRKIRGGYGTSINDINLECWYKKRRI